MAMKQYIDKSALVAEIKRRINEINLDTIEDWRYRLQWEHDIEVMKNILSLIDTLEVKEVDFDEEFNKYHIGLYNPFNSGADIYEFAKHFFELGLKTQKGE